MTTSPYSPSNDPHANTKRVFAVTGLTILTGITSALVVVAALR